VIRKALHVLRRWEYALSILIVASACAFGAYTYLNSLDEPEQTGQPRYMPGSPEMPEGAAAPEQILQSLLTAIERRDYATVERYAMALFDERTDLEIADLLYDLNDPVLLAAKTGDVQLFNALLVAKPVFGAFDREGRSALHIAAENDHDEIVRWLAENLGVDINQPVEHTRLTALHLAASGGSTKAIATLVDLDASPLALSARGRTPLHHAVDVGNARGTRALLDAANTRRLDPGLTVMDDDGNTPLHLAARRGDMPVVRMLLEAGARRDTRNNAGETPLQSAVSHGHARIAELIE